MRARAKYCGQTRDAGGELLLLFSVDDDSKMANDIEGYSDVIIDVHKHREKRSSEANRYLWKLCDLLAKALGTDKDSIYLMELKHYGVFEDIAIPAEAVKMLSDKYRYIEVLREREIDYNGELMKMAEVRCYIGSHLYDTKQFSELLNGLVNECNDAGVETYPDEEINALIEAYEPEGT